MIADKVPSSPTEWVMKVRGLKGKNDLKGALEECKKALASFPTSVDLLYTYGELRVTCFNKVKKTEHLKIALTSFEKLLKANPGHYMANLVTAQIYFKAHAYSRAETKANVILKSSPNDTKALKIKQAVNIKLGKETGETGKQKEVDLSDTDNITTEKMEGLQEGEWLEYDDLVKRLAYFDKLKGLKHIQLIDPAGVTIKTVAKSGKPHEALATAAADIFRTSGATTRKLGVGNFQKGQLHTPSGIIMLVNVFYGILVMVVDTEADLKDVNDRINRYVDKLAE